MWKRLFPLSLLMVLGTGCTAGFTGEWLEEGVAGPAGQTISPTGERRMALSFDPISGMRYGEFDERRSVVDNLSVQDSDYFVFDGWSRAQFGLTLARVDGDHLHAGINGGTERTFTRVKGPAIFPPTVQIPSLTE